MQATPDVIPKNDESSPYLNQKAGSLPEYVYQAAILVAILLMIWTAA